MDVFALCAAYNLHALYNIHIKKMQATKAAFITLNAGIKAENKINASAGV